MHLRSTASTDGFRNGTRYRRLLETFGRRAHDGSIPHRISQNFYPRQVSIAARSCPDPSYVYTYVPTGDWRRCDRAGRAARLTSSVRLRRHHAWSRRVRSGLVTKWAIRPYEGSCSICYSVDGSSALITQALHDDARPWRMRIAEAVVCLGSGKAGVYLVSHEGTVISSRSPSPAAAIYCMPDESPQAELMLSVKSIRLLSGACRGRKDLRFV